METYELIRATSNLIDNRDNWTQGTDARDVRGNPVFSQSSCAVRFCITGGMTHLGSTFLEQQAARKVLQQTAIYKRYDYEGVEHFNDRESHSNVLLMLNQALRMIESGAQSC